MIRCLIHRSVHAQSVMHTTAPDKRHRYGFLRTESLTPPRREPNPAFIHEALSVPIFCIWNALIREVGSSILLAFQTIKEPQHCNITIMRSLYRHVGLDR